MKNALTSNDKEEKTSTNNSEEMQVLLSEKDNIIDKNKA
jgi:hypothetical protein